MKENIIIVGAGTDAGLLGKAIAHLGEDNVVIIDADNVKKEQLTYPKSEPYIINKLPELKSLYGEKKFICKGRHEYREIKGEWICQCGRKLSD